MESSVNSDSERPPTSDQGIVNALGIDYLWATASPQDHSPRRKRLKAVQAALGSNP